LAQNACLLAWTGQDAVRLYAHSTGATHSARRLIRQAALVSDLNQREQIARRMYFFRFTTKPPDSTTIEQLRGMEGNRVRTIYAQYAARFGVPWSGRNYDPGNWVYADPINRALSTASACLNGVCHAAIVAAGYSAGLGFIHTGKMLSFVYDIADLYKMDLSVRVAFEVAARKPDPLERAVRMACREAFAEFRLMNRLFPDIQEVLGAGDDLGEGADDAEGRVISLADRAQDWGFPRESDEPSQGEAMGEGAEEV
jgi:CRISPR-associated protein Cas1